MIYYEIYDLKNKEQCVFIGNSEEVSNFLGIDKHRIYEIVCRKIKVKCRYEIISLKMDKVVE